MSLNAAIDVAVALTVMYLLLSLTCTVINEYIASKLNLRSKSLGVALQALLDDLAVRKAFYEHGLIAGTRTALTTAGRMSVVRSLRFDPPAASSVATDSGGSSAPETPVPATAAGATTSDKLPATGVPASAGLGSSAPPVLRAPVTSAATTTSDSAHPSYVSTNTFVLALLGSLTGAKTPESQGIPTFADIEAAIQKLPHSNLRDALVTNLITAQGDFDKFRAGIAKWFDDSMDRLSGAYKRHLKLISIAVGCLVAAFLNADTFAVSRVLWSDSAFRTQMVAVADSTVKAGLPADSTEGKTTKAPTANDIEQRLVQANNTLRPLPIGWPLSANASLDQLMDHIENKPWSYWPLKLLGLFATGLALSFGAPFWFDALSKFMNIRAAGVKPVRQM